MSVSQSHDKLQTFNLWLNGLLGVGTVAVAVAGYFAVLYPFNVLAQDIRTEAGGYETLIQQAAEITKTHQTLTLELAEARRAAKELATRIPAAPRESDFLSQIYHLAKQTGLEVADYHPGAVDSQENHQEMEVKINAQGEYEALSKFLKQIDGLPRLCRLVHLQVETKEKQTALEVEMLFKIYFAPPSNADTVVKGTPSREIN